MDTVLYIVFPYVALALAFGGGIYRYVTARFTYSSLSSELLERRWLFLGSPVWHYAIIPILLVHLYGGTVAVLLAPVLRGTTFAYVLDLAAYTFGLLALFGLAVLIVRRVAHAKLRAVTSVMDWILLADLLLQVVLGILIALSYKWGVRWYAVTATPWFLSIVRLAPDAGTIVPLPALVKLHAFNGFVLFALFPFTRLVHMVSLPLGYLRRPFLVFVWNRRRRRNAASKESAP